MRNSHTKHNTKSMIFVSIILNRPPSNYYCDIKLVANQMQKSQSKMSKAKHEYIGLLTTKSIQRPPLPLERIHYIERSDRLSLGVLRIRHSIPNDILQERLEHPPGLFVNQP